MRLSLLNDTDCAARTPTTPTKRSHVDMRQHAKRSRSGISPLAVTPTPQNSGHGHRKDSRATLSLACSQRILNLGQTRRRHVNMNKLVHFE
jgi:hypothetical protein